VLVLRIAHRGVPRRLPENTLPSFSAALALGANGIELDVHATSDGVVVVHHDAALADARTIERMQWRELREVEVAPGTTIPTLDDVCGLVGARAELFVEIKGETIEDMVVAVLGRHPATSAAIHSFDHALIARIARRTVGYRLGLLVEAEPEDACELLRRHGALDLWPERGLVTERLVGEVHACGGRVIPWTVNDPSEAARFARLGVDGLCTDDVSLLP